MKYENYGPYELDCPINTKLSSKQPSLWDAMEADREGLSNAKGVYIFGINSSGGDRISPWYVGKTEEQGFRNEALVAHKLLVYREVLGDYDRARCYLFFLARVTDKGRLYKGRNAIDIDFVEKMMIAQALHANPDLANKRDTKLLRNIVLPGFINTPQGGPTTARNELLVCLGMKE